MLDLPDMINQPIIVFRGCTLPELFKVAKLLLVGQLLIFSIIGIVLFGATNGLSYSLGVSMLLELPLCWFCWGLLGRLKCGRPEGFYEQKFTLLWQRLFNINSPKSLYVTKTHWSVQREIKDV